MRSLLLASIFALLLGALSIWLMQQGGGYVLINFNNITVEMTVWVALLLYLIVTGLVVWLFLLVKWSASAGGLGAWWSSRASSKTINRTKQGLILYADHEWQRAVEVLTKSAEKSVMPEVDLLFAIRAASENGQSEEANSLIKKLKTSYPKFKFLAQKNLVELNIHDEKFDLALDILKPLTVERPDDPGILRLLADIYYLKGDWESLRFMLHDMYRFKALDKLDMTLLEFDVYHNLLSEFRVNPESSQQDQRKQVADLWAMIPKRLREDSHLTCCYFDLLLSVNHTETVIPIMIKSINNQWNDELVRRFGEPMIPKPEIRLAAAEKWLTKHPENAILLMTLGHICCQLKFWGKARDYFSSALTLSPSPLLYASLGEVMIHFGEVDAAQDLFKKGLMLGIDKNFEN